MGKAEELVRRDLARRALRCLEYLDDVNAALRLGRPPSGKALNWLAAHKAETKDALRRASSVAEER